VKEMEVNVQANILVVDDEKTARDSLADILQLEGYDVETAAEGQQALDILHKHEFDLMLLDLKMPGMDGMDVLRQAALISPNMQIILLTAHGSLESAIEALRFGAHDYLLKPCPPGQIVQSVRSGLARHSELRNQQALVSQYQENTHPVNDLEIGGPMAGDRPGVYRLRQGWVFDSNRREANMGDVSVTLTASESKLLKVLLDNYQHVMSHRDLVEKTQGYETTEWDAPEVLRPLISRLRRKLSAFPNGDQWIVNVRGAGYMFDDQA